MPHMTVISCLAYPSLTLILTLNPHPTRSSNTAALFGNLGGVTSGLLALDGGRLAGRARLDVIIPVGGFKRCADYENGYGALAGSRQQVHDLHPYICEFS